MKKQPAPGMATQQKALNGWTKDAIQHLLRTNDKAVGRALLQIYARQTQAEQRCKDTQEDNGVGFTGVDGQFLSDVAERYKKYPMLTPKQMAIVRPKMLKYWKQLLAIAAMSPTGPNFEVPVTKKLESAKPQATTQNSQTCLMA